MKTLQCKLYSWTAAIMFSSLATVAMEGRGYRHPAGVLMCTKCMRWWSCWLFVVLYNFCRAETGYPIGLYNASPKSALFLRLVGIRPTGPPALFVSKNDPNKCTPNFPQIFTAYVSIFHIKTWKFSIKITLYSTKLLQTCLLNHVQNVNNDLQSLDGLNFGGFHGLDNF